MQVLIPEAIPRVNTCSTECVTCSSRENIRVGNLDLGYSCSMPNFLIYPCLALVLYTNRYLGRLFSSGKPTSGREDSFLDTPDTHVCHGTTKGEFGVLVDNSLLREERNAPTYTWRWTQSSGHCVATQQASG